MPSSDEHAPLATARAWPGALDAEVFETLFRECGADVHGYAISLLGDRSAAKDVTALAFERLYTPSASRYAIGSGAKKTRVASSSQLPWVGRVGIERVNATPEQPLNLPYLQERWPSG